MHVVFGIEYTTTTGASIGPLDHPQNREDDGQAARESPRKSGRKTMKRIAAISLYALTGVVSITMGAIYLFSPEFMPYHSVALGRDWHDLQNSEQVLLGALLDVAGAGWIALGTAVIVLAIIPMRRGEMWARLLVPFLLVLFYLPTLLATLSVLEKTAASPPWYGNAFALLATAIGFALDRPWR